MKLDKSTLERIEKDAAIYAAPIINPTAKGAAEFGYIQGALAEREKTLREVEVFFNEWIPDNITARFVKHFGLSGEGDE